jgi:hypothetical protein
LRRRGPGPRGAAHMAAGAARPRRGEGDHRARVGDAGRGRTRAHAEEGPGARRGGGCSTCAGAAAQGVTAGRRWPPRRLVQPGVHRRAGARHGGGGDRSRVPRRRPPPGTRAPGVARRRSSRVAVRATEPAGDERRALRGSRIVPGGVRLPHPGSPGWPGGLRRCTSVSPGLAWG